MVRTCCTPLKYKTHHKKRGHPIDTGFQANRQLSELRLGERFKKSVAKENQTFEDLIDISQIEAVRKKPC
jgi:hypothetical protein